MSRRDDDIEDIEECDCCHKSMTHNEFAFVVDEDMGDDPEFFAYLDHKKYQKLCHRCFSEMRKKMAKEEAIEYEAFSEAMNKQAKEKE